MMTATDQFAAAQAKASVPGSAILMEWRAQREAARKEGALRNETYSASDPRVLEFFGVQPSASGVYVSPTSAMRVSAVFACVQRIAGAIASMPLHQYERTPDGRQRVENAPLWWLLNEQPTPRFSAASMWEGRVAHMLLRGDGYAFMGRDKAGTVREIVPLPWEAVEPVRHTDGGEDRLKYYVNDVTRYGVDQDDMLHFPGFGFDGLRGMSVIQWAARNAAGNALAMDEYSGKFFAGGAHPSIVLEAPGPMKQTAIDSLQQAFRNKYSGLDNAHKMPLLLTDGIKANSFSVNADDAQLLDARKFQVIDIARAFGVPPHMIGETSGSTSWGTGLEQMNRAFVTYTLNQHLNRIEQELNRKLFRISKYFVEFNRAALMEGDSKAQAEYFRAALGGPGTGRGWMSTDEVRRVQNLPPKGGQAAELFEPTQTANSAQKGAAN